MSLPSDILLHFGITDKDREFFSARNKPLEDVLDELEALRSQQVYPRTIEPALIKNSLIRRLSLADLTLLEREFASTWVDKRNFEIFIPAAGAASRQLLLLRTILNHPALEGLRSPRQLVDRANSQVASLQAELATEGSPRSSESIKADLKVLREVADSTLRFWQEGIIDKRFAFVSELERRLLETKGLSLSELINERDLRTIADFLLSPEGLNYGQLPKLLMHIHSYNIGEGDSDDRLTLEEHIREAASLLKGARGLRLHFPISEEHQVLVDEALAELRNKDELMFFLKRHGFNIDEVSITFSYQDQTTDSVSLLVSSKQLAREKDGEPLLRKAGHGALISNLSRLKSDSIWVNNVDNILYDNPHIKRIVLFYKRAMASLGLTLEKKLHEFIKELEGLRIGTQKRSRPEDGGLDGHGLSDILNRTLAFLDAELQTKIRREVFSSLSASEQIDTLLNLLKRPVVVAGFVPLEPGQAGGGPFALEVEIIDGVVATKVNIVEQSEFKDGASDSNFRSGEFFNPVMLFITRKAFDGSLYPLDNLNDPSRFFRSEKTDSFGQVLLAYERPGLWNGGIVKAFQVNIALPSCVFAAIKDIAGKESPLSKLHQPYSGPAISELDEVREVVDEELKRFLDQ